MPTNAEIISWVRRKYPKATTTYISNVDMLNDLSDINTEILTELGRFSNDPKTDSTVVTEAGQEEYTLPTGCRMPCIISLEVSTDADETDWNKFKFRGANDDISTGYFYLKGTNKGDIKLLIDGKAITTSDLVVRIKYHEDYIKLTNAAHTLGEDVPGLEERYHNIYKYALIQSAAATGETPDYDIVNYWAAEYLRYFEAVKDRLLEEYNTTPDELMQVKAVW
jgi:hypothetical protein